jgi:RNA polymerase sigma-70 factor (ECF subfamily)
MSVASQERVRPAGPTAAKQPIAPWRRILRPIHARAVHRFRTAAESADVSKLRSLLAPDVAVVIDAGDVEHPTIRVIAGIQDAVTMLLHGMAGRPGLSIDERAVNGQAGLTLNHFDEEFATITIDFTARLVGVVWIRLHPETLRHWKHV